MLDRQLLEKQQVLTLADALMNTPGVYVMGTTGGYQQEIAGRGYAFGSSNTFKNGMRYFNGIMPEMVTLERVEILKGSAAILYGNVAAGGVLNLVTKKPSFRQGGEVSMRLGSFGFYKPYLDVYGPVGNAGRVAFRVQTTYEKAGSFRDVVQSERLYINPSLIWNLSPATELLIEADYLSDRRTPDFGTGAVNYTIAEVPRSRFLGVEWGRFSATQASLMATLTHRFNQKWQLQLRGGQQDYATELFSATRPNAGNFVQPNGDWVRGIQRNRATDSYQLLQADLTGQFSTGRISHQVLAGADAERFRPTTTAFVSLARYDTVNIFDPAKFRARQDIPALAENTITHAPVSRFGVYVQDLLALTPRLKLLVGLRYTYQQTLSDVYTVARKTSVLSSNFDGAFTPRFGLVVQPLRTLSVFASYASSFTLNTGVDISGNALPPSLIHQYEAGLKNELFNGLFSANVVAYRIINTNLAQTSLVNANTYTYVKELAGEVTSQGLEADLRTRAWRGLSLLAGYSYNDTRYTRSNIYVVGSRLRYNPNHTGHLSLFFVPAKAKGLSFGLTGLYVGDRVAGRSTRLTVNNDAYRLMPVPAYTQLDASVGYINSQLSLRLKVGNVLNKLSYNVHDDNSVNPITPRNLSVTAAYKF